jgi:hypothetical protein
MESTMSDKPAARLPTGIVEPSDGELRLLRELVQETSGILHARTAREDEGYTRF